MTRHTHGKKIHKNIDTYSFHRNQFKIDHRYKSKTLKFFENITVENVGDLDLVMTFLDMKPKAQSMKKLKS